MIHLNRQQRRNPQHPILPLITSSVSKVSNGYKRGKCGLKPNKAKFKGKGNGDRGRD